MGPVAHGPAAPGGDSSSAPSGEVSEQAACICPLQGGLTGAWFTHLPVTFQKTTNPIPVYASGCQLSCADGQPLIGTHTLTPESWSVENPNLITGSTAWVLFGRELQHGSQLEQQFTPIIPAIGSGLIHLARMLVADQPRNDVQGCETSCKGSTFCKSMPVEEKDVLGLRHLYASLASKPSTIKKSELLSMFGMPNDECKRQDTLIAWGTRTNTGDICHLGPVIPSLGIRLSIEIPSVLSGRLSEQNGTISLDLSDANEKPTLQILPIERSNKTQVENAKYLQFDWGGDVKTVFGNATQITFGVGERGSCLRAQLSSN
jgi:hypothetical protein